MEQKEVDKDDANSNSFLSILQRSYVSIQPIIIEINKRLVKEENGIDHLESKAEKYVTTDDAKATYAQLYKDRDPNKIDMKNVLGFMNQNLYHDYMNITNIMKLKRLDFRDVYGNRSPDLILTRENLVERFILLIASYFCIGTELRFLKQMNTDGFDTQDAEFWHGKAVELAVNFLPSNAPLVKHIVSSYQKHHSPWNDKIPEDNEVEEDVEIFKAQNGVFNSKLSPVIKKVTQTTIKLTVLDIPINDYLADIFDDKEDENSQKPLDALDSNNQDDQQNNLDKDESTKNKISRPSTSKGKRVFIRTSNNTDQTRTVDSNAGSEIKYSTADKEDGPVTLHENSRNRKNRRLRYVIWCLFIIVRIRANMIITPQQL
jgi:hypothetical protein